MDIVVLDGYTLNPGDIDWQALEQLGNLTIYERTADEQIVERIGQAEIVLTNKTPLSATTLAQLPSLQYIGVLATGTNVVDAEYARGLGIPVTNVPAYAPDAVAQMVFAHILHYTQQVARHHDAVKQGEWVECPDFCFTLSPLQSLKGKVMGLVGYGDIGKQVANIALAFGMSVLIHTRTQPKNLPVGITWRDLNTLYAQADILSLHCPLSSQTEKMINASSLAQMKSSALLINTGRGLLIDEDALALALEQGDIAFAGLDVLSTEPPAADNPLLGAPNTAITPHIAWATKEARQALLQIATDNVRMFIAGTIQNCVNK